MIAISAISPISKKILTIKAKGIHNGAVTHSHDQLTYPVNLRIRKTINNAPPNPIPLLPIATTAFLLSTVAHPFFYEYYTNF
jgi:hypothetical protein